MSILNYKAFINEAQDHVELDEPYCLLSTSNKILKEFSKEPFDADVMKEVSKDVGKEIIDYEEIDRENINFKDSDGNKYHYILKKKRFC